MTGAMLVLALFLIAQVIAATTMAGLGHALQAVNPDAGILAWMVVGVMGIVAAVAFLTFALNYRRWLQWPR